MKRLQQPRAVCATLSFRNDQRVDVCNRTLVTGRLAAILTAAIAVAGAANV
jgi:hypothetical protein